MNKVQVIEKEGKPEWVVIPYELYLQLVEQAEMAQDLRDFDAIKASIARGEEEIVPSEVTYALLDGQNPLKVWREYRGLTQKELAKVAEISVPYLSQIETGKRTGSTAVLANLAEALDLTLDDIVVK